MRYFTFILCVSCGLVACSSTPPVQPSTQTLVSTLEPVDLSQKPSFIESKLDQYKVAGFSVGSWVNQKPGQYFQLVKPQQEQAAVVYMYRPDSRWNRQEIVAPNFFLNGERIPSLLSNHYYWMELPAGDYRLTVSRPLAVVHFQKPIAANFKVEAGQQYFVKYEEEEFRGGPNDGAGLLKSGPLMQMPTKQGLKEIAMTQLKSPGLNFVAYVNEQGQLIKPQRDMKNSMYHESDDVHAKERFKIWKPMTW